MKLCSRLLKVFCQNFFKRCKFGHLNPILRKLGVTHDLGWWLVGKLVVDFLFIILELFSLSLTVETLWAEICWSQVTIFRRRVRHFQQIFDREGAVPTNQCWCQKTRVTAISCSIKISAVHHLVLSQYIHLTDGQTDGRTDGRTDRQTELWQQYHALIYMQSHCKNDSTV